eukprot:TRINITY_DN3131_c0_g1_i3.p1 TRINITY_DN3131_c0_g1~~TRINITY_DN3131_c0_g1_i3.p1  ORF type:complete len:213 (-),score=42.70 TRINITY_DN3131_c0_g1_i3:12-650(-)
MCIRDSNKRMNDKKAILKETIIHKFREKYGDEAVSIAQSHLLSIKKKDKISVDVLDKLDQEISRKVANLSSSRKLNPNKKVDSRDIRERAMALYSKIHGSPKKNDDDIGHRTLSVGVRMPTNLSIGGPQTPMNRVFGQTAGPEEMIKTQREGSPDHPLESPMNASPTYLNRTYIRPARSKSIWDTIVLKKYCLLYTSPSPRDRQKSRMPSSA